MELRIAAKKILDDLNQVIDDISSEDYKRPVPVLNGSTIGQHVRHILEFFLCLNDGYFWGVVNYDNRKRNRLIEESKDAAMIYIRKILEAVRIYHLEHGLYLELSYDEEGEGNVQIYTNYQRELAYNIEHSVHHMALIRIGIKEIAMYVQLPENFGVAVSTVRHQQNRTIAQAS
jgi:hypothetical protein